MTQEQEPVHMNYSQHRIMPTAAEQIIQTPYQQDNNKRYNR